ncbi:HNH endonuclease [Amycolatopsis sp. NPDC058278]|uniref:HNH endonuclease n=1 Tax=Amycolatopsis sp. NPDC058278 TaxID=3346417 RepID=UPI0036DB41FA
MTDVRYQPNGNNDVLKHALVTAWRWKCSWCPKLLDDQPTEIDHIVPQDSNEATRERMKHQYSLSENYDIHAPYNLAPICRPCNAEKGNHDFTNSPRLLSLLKKAHGLAPKVERSVRALEQRRTLSTALLKAAVVDLSDEITREAFEAGAPAIVQRLASLGAEKADFFISQTFQPEINNRFLQVELVLNERGRTLLAIFEEVAGGDPETSLLEPIAELVEQAESAANSAFEAADALRGPDVEPLSANAEFVIDHVDFERTLQMQLTFTFTGTFSAEGSTTIARDTVDGDGVEYIQGDADVTGEFKVVLSWSPSDPPGDFTVDDASLEAESVYVSNAGPDAQYSEDPFDTDLRS